MIPANRSQLQKMLIKQEGMELKVYKDSRGYSTIGCGRNLTTKGISSEEALYLLQNDIQDTIHNLVLHLPWYVRLNDARQAALISHGMNIGFPGLLSWHHTLIALQDGEWQAAHDAVLESLAAKQAICRYSEIATMYLTGEFI